MYYLGLIFLKCLGYFLSFFPRIFFLFLGKKLGFLLLAFGFRRQVVDGNLSLAFPYLTAAEREKFLREYYPELGIMFLEILLSFYRFDRFLDRHADVEGGEHLAAALSEGKGVFVMSAHLGNWEVLVASGPRFFSTGVTIVTKKLKPDWFHRITDVTRYQLGVGMACEPKTMQSILKTLKKKEIVGFMMDQYAGAPVGARVPFFGYPVGSQTALAALALRTGSPVVPAIAIRKPNGRYLVRFEPKLVLIKSEDLEKAVIENTALYVRHTEAWIKEFPMQWLWIHRRWKGDLSPLPGGETGEMLK